jgi:hypothetical protein
MSRVSCGVPTQLDLIIRSLPRSSKDWRDQMTQLETELDGPDFTQGVKISTVPDGTMLLGQDVSVPANALIACKSVIKESPDGPS